MSSDHQGPVSAEVQPNSPTAEQPLSEPPLHESRRVEGLALRVRLAHPECWGVALALCAAILFNLIALYPEVSVDAPPFNDNVLHLLNIRHVAQAVTEGRDPTDPWVGQVTLGFPLFRHYQHLPYLPPGLLVALTHGALSAEAALRWHTYLLLSLFPLSLYGAGRRWGLARLPALFAALLGPLVATQGLYGFEANSYVWSGYGLYTQLWGMWLLPLALAQGYAVLRTGRGYLGAVALIAATLLSHLVYGYILLASLALLAALGPWRTRPSGEAWLGKRAARLLGLLALTGLAASYFLLPYLADRAVMNRSIWELPWKYQSFGAPWVLNALLRGQLLDAGRFPTLTLLFVLGAAYCLWRWEEERYRALASVTLLWLLLYFGRPTWGVLLDLLPMGRDLHLHRLIGGFHLGAIYLAGLGLAWLWDMARSRKDRRYLLAAAALTALLLWPAYRERAAYYRQNRAWMAETATAVAAERESLDALVEAIRALPPGRVYAGLANRWGREIKVGAAPLYALLQNAGLDMVGYLYHALSLNADLQVLFDDGRWEQYDLFNIRYVVLPQDWTVPAFYRALGDYGRFRLFEVPTGGYFELVDSDLVLAGGKEDLHQAASLWLAGSLPLAQQHPQVLLGATPRGDASVRPLAEAERALAALPALPTAARGVILHQSAGAQVYEAEVQVGRECALMLKVGYHPRWRATVDGAAAETIMLLPGYLGVRLPPGRQTVRLAYAPGPGRVILMGLGALTLLLVALAERRREATARLLARWRAGPMAAWLRGVMVRQARPQSPCCWARSAALLSRREKIGIYLFLFSIYLATGAGHFFSTDHVAVYLTAQSLVERGDLAIKPMHDAVQGPDGRYYSSFGIGQSLALAPFYLVGRAVERVASPEVARYFGGPDLGDWGGTVPIFFASLLNQFITPLICLLLLQFCLRLGCSRRASWAVTLTFGLATAAWPYARDSFQHPLESLLLLTAVYLLYAYRQRLFPWGALGAGLALAGAALTRVNALWVAPALGVYLLHLVLAREPASALGDAAPPPLMRWRRTAQDAAARLLRPRALATLLLFGAPVLLAFGAVLWLNRLKYGAPLSFHPLAQAAGFSNPLWVGLYGQLFSLGRSLFLYSPPLVLVFWAARPFHRRHRAEALLFAAIAIIYLLGYSAYGYWEGGWSWGNRFLLATLPYLAIPLADYVTTRGRAVALAALGALGAAVQVLGVAVNWSYVHWEWMRMGLSPRNAYLYVPAISPLAMHWRALWAGQHIDLWLLHVLHSFGWPTFLWTLALPLALLLAGLWMLRAFAWLHARLTSRHQG